jgi:hypothetical protein
MVSARLCAQICTVLLVQKPKIQVVLVVIRICLSARHRSANTGFEALALQVDLLVDLFARFLLSGARTGQNLELEGAVPKHHERTQ